MSFVFDTSKPIAIGADHAGVDYKAQVKTWLETKGYTVKDFGTYNADSVDYPDFAHPTATSVETGESAFGILFCGSANGVAMTANKHNGIRAGLAWNKEVAALIRQHNDANILVMPARFTSIEEAKEITKTYLETPFEGGRHQRRIDMITIL